MGDSEYYTNLQVVLAAADLGKNRAFQLLPEGVTYNGDGTVATSTTGGITTSYTYDVNGNVLTEARLGKTKTYSYDGAGNVSGATVS